MSSCQAVLQSERHGRKPVTIDNEGDRQSTGRRAAEVPPRASSHNRREREREADRDRECAREKPFQNTSASPATCHLPCPWEASALWARLVLGIYLPCCTHAPRCMTQSAPAEKRLVRSLSRFPSCQTGIGPVYRVQRSTSRRAVCPIWIRRTAKGPVLVVPN